MGGETWLEELAAAVRARGAAPIARELRVPRQAILTVLAGVARQGNVLLVRARMAERARGVASTPEAAR